MKRELLISIYLAFYSILYAIFKLLPLKKKIVIMASFKGNNDYLYNELVNQNFSDEIVFLCKESCYDYFKEKNDRAYLLEKFRIIDEVKAAYHLMTAKTIIVDNYYGLLAAAKFRSDVECIQIWHATGAIKSFGFLDPAVHSRSEREQQRIKSVYSNFHKVVVGSPLFGEIFQKAFLIEPSQILPFGFPRTDFYFDSVQQEELRLAFYKKYPYIENKKVILYAPTYRPNPEDNKMTLDIELMKEKLPEDYALVIHLHPAQSKEVVNGLANENFVYSFNETIEELMLISDMLITDYSSIPFEYVFLQKPMIFYPYDLDTYALNPGLWTNYKEIVPAPIAFNTTEVIDAILSYPFGEINYQGFKNEWNQYSTGISSVKLVEYILKRHSEFN